MRQAMKEAKPGREVPIEPSWSGRPCDRRGWNQVETLKDATARLYGNDRPDGRPGSPGGLAAGRLHPVRHQGAVPHVRGSHRALPPGPCGIRLSGRQDGSRRRVDQPPGFPIPPPSTTGARCSPECWGRNACTTCSNFSGRPALLAREKRKQAGELPSSPQDGGKFVS